ncbi:MAG: DUF2806 domain-containing protein [Trueperaceae bacterium]|nr:DUF2806 domain-containing protein [Trueperaceae bacterium]
MKSLSEASAQEQLLMERLSQVYKSATGGDLYRVLCDYQNEDLISKNQLPSDELEIVQNIISIIDLALSSLPSQANIGDLSDFWLQHYLSKAHSLSKPYLQEIWASLLKLEATHAGTVPIASLNALAQLEEESLNWFAALCRFSINPVDPIPLIYSVEDDIYKQQGLSTRALLELEADGLIFMRNDPGYFRKVLPPSGQITYFGQTLGFDVSKSNDLLNIGTVVFSANGKTLAAVLTPSPVPDFLDHLKSHWTHLGYLAKD